MGQDIRQYLQLDDSILELKTYANRGDSMSVLGVAREVAALTGRPLKAPPAVTVPVTAAAGTPSKVEAPKATPRLLTRRIEGLNNGGTSPGWMVERDGDPVTAERVERAHTMGNQPGNGDFMHAMVHALGTWRGVRPEWRERLLREVTETERPVLVIWGDRDKVLPASHLDTALATFPHASSRLFEGVGHMPQIETPDECARVIREFLLSVPDQGSDGSPTD